MKDVLSMVMPGADCVSWLSPTPVGVRAHRPGSYTHIETLVNTYCNSLSYHLLSAHQYLEQSLLLYWVHTLSLVSSLNPSELESLQAAVEKSDSARPPLTLRRPRDS